MCGIAGVIGLEIAHKEAIVGNMVAKIVHRGPDDDGFFIDKYVGLGMRRLSIIDLSTGRQPVTTDDGKLLIFFNGEIYNYKELRAELVDKGVKFKTQGDTEVILRMYEMYGESMLTRLRGMFAFCIYNTETKEVFIARDFFGIKPFYYLMQSEKIVAFSSEIKSFQSFPGFKAEVNDNAVVNYLSFQYNPLTETFFKNVYKLPPAHFLKINVETGEVKIKKYWSFEFRPNESLDESKTVKNIHDTIKDSVEHHMIADVPIASFLSGGIDSSIIASLVQEARGDKKIKTFTVGFDTLTEAKEAVETASFLGTDHTELTVGPDEYFSALSKAVYHFDEPVADPSAIGLYFLAEEARKHVKVVLSGEGADELFGGYNIYLAPFASEKMRWIPKFILNIFINFPFEYFGKNYLRRVNLKLSDWYIGNASVFKKEEVDKLWKGKNKKTISLNSLYKNVANLSDSTKMQYIDINTWLVGDILAKADKMTMAHSLELRVPFLDVEVAKLASQLPNNFKWRGGVTKYLLRQAFSKVIPESTRNRKKLGFPTPVRDWFTKDRQDVYDTILNNDYVKSHMDTSYIKNIIDDQISKRVDNSRKIYLLLMLSLWYNIFIKQIKPS
ncbi:MAG: asparagine synthase (glutamine-hydrolyzing) [Minisyncoccia bacterium]